MKYLINVTFSIFFLFTLVSCSGGGDDNDITNPEDQVKSIKLSVSNEYVELNNQAVFEVLSDKNKVLTSSCKFYVNNEEITGNTFKGDLGDYSVYATYKQLISTPKTFNIIPEIVYYKTNVLVEDYTGTWCGWCPRVSQAIKLLKEETNQISIVAVHVGDNMEISQSNTLTNTFGVNSYPHVQLNRTSKWDGDQPNNLTAVTNLTASPKKIGIALVSSLHKKSNGDVGLNLKVKVQFGFPYTDLKLVVFVLENGIIADQTNFTSYFPNLDKYTASNGNPISKDFVHDNVLRKSLTAVLGDNIESSSSKSGNTFEKGFIYDIPAGYDIMKMEIVAFVVNKDKQAINSRMSNIEENQTFEKQ
jgi:thiol-disulfide isomerase/thioredoxin